MKVSTISYWLIQIYLHYPLKRIQNWQTLKQNLERTLSRNNIKFSELKNKIYAKVITYHELGLTLFMGLCLTELKFGLTLWKYFASKLTVTSQNYLSNVSFPTEYNNISFFKF